ncbi:MAG: M13 family metallopeptidase N-terminal domain-containing protein, partial [Rhizobacter sp.]
MFAIVPAHAQPASGIVRADIDARIRPQDDFYAHANGGWLKRAVFPADKSYLGPAEEMQDRIQTQLRALIAAARHRPGDAEATQLADLYASFMDEAAVNRLGVTPLANDLAAIAAITDTKQLAPLFAQLGQIGVDTPMGLAIVQDDRDATRYVPALVQSGLGLPTRDYYLKQGDATFRGVRQKYLAYLAKLLALADGRGARANEPAARAILALETEIARVQWDPVDNRDPVKSYNPVALGELPALAPAVDWPGVLATAGLAGKTDKLLVRQPSYWRGLSPLLSSVPLGTWKAYARVRLLDAYAPYLGQDFVATRFAFAGTVLGGATQNPARWKRGIRLVNDSLGESLGRLYVEEHFPPASKQRVEAMVANLLGSYRESIATLDWMSPETRQ